jgi:hypothetical protein
MATHVLLGQGFGKRLYGSRPHDRYPPLLPLATGEERREDQKTQPMNPP